MTQSTVVILALSTLCNVKAAEHSVVTDNVVSSKYERIAKDARATLGHTGMCGIEVARLADRRVKASKSKQLGRRGEAVDVANLAKDHPGFDEAHTGDGQDDGVESLHNGFYLGFDIMDLAIQ